MKTTIEQPRNSNLRTMLLTYTMLGIVILVTSFATVPVYAQSKLGVGGGIAVPNHQIAQLPENLVRNGWDGIVEQSRQGIYIEARARIGKELGFVGGISYNRFPEAISSFHDGSGRDISLETAQSVVPISAGIDWKLGESGITPHFSLEATYNYYYRSFQSVSGATTVPFEFESAGDSRFGAALGGGFFFDLSILQLDLGARVHLMNLFNKENEELQVYHLQLGAILYFGGE